MNFVGYDIETEGAEPGYALQPWRARERSGRITLTSMYATGLPPAISMCAVDHNRALSTLASTKKPVALYNAIFDLAWLYASGYDVRDILWYDAMLLWKWLDNSQSFEFYPHTLKHAAIRFLPTWDKLQEFIEIKESGDEMLGDPESPYWVDRVILDAQATALVAEAIWPQLTRQQQTSATLQAMGLPTIAASWVNGIHLDVDRIAASEWPIVKELIEIEETLDLVEVDTWTSSDGVDYHYIPSKVLRSPTKLAKLLYEDYGLPCTRWTDGGASGVKKKSADKVALTYLSERDDRVMEIMRWRKLNTIHTKFVSGALKTYEYLQSPITHSQPRVFATYTGRMTYSSYQGKGATRVKIGVPQHQTPREKAVRSYTIAPPGCYIVEFDARGQEMRGMATVAKEQTMIDLFNRKPPRDNAHALMGATIGGYDFDDFLQAKHDGVEEVAGPHGYYMAGKVCNLSKSYRISDRSLRVTARVDYGMTVPLAEVQMWSLQYHNQFPGVKDYWLQAPRRAQAMGYASTLADRRYGITKWDKTNQWRSSSSAISSARSSTDGRKSPHRDLPVAFRAYRRGGGHRLPDLDYLRRRHA